MPAKATQTTTELVGDIAIPESAYETAKGRYQDLAEWLARPEANTRGFSPHVYPQGSFRLGTVVRPLNPESDYDLDLGCRMIRGITKQNHSQKALKKLVGDELELYRKARQIRESLEELHRCWRLQYRDQLRFHMDVVPSIPEERSRQEGVRALMVEAGVPNDLSRAISAQTGAITDDRHPQYASLTDDWRISNSEGYALWFESRMKVADQLMQERARRAHVGRIDDLPAYQWRSPLQAAIQILKRHRDVMYAENPESQPISIVITTLSGHAYAGQPDVVDALQAILRDMDQYIRPTAPRVPNPVNPAEDFADKWYSPPYAHLDLERHFYSWLARAREDFNVFLSQRDARLVAEFAWKKFASSIDPDRLDTGHAALGIAAGLSFPPQPVVPTKPAGFA